MIELDFFDSSNKFGVIKATVHKTGKLGFSSGASKFMDIENVNSFNIGLNKADVDDKNLYLVPAESATDKSFKVVRAGEYYYIFIKNILRELKVDYKNESVIYDIEDIENDGKQLFKLTRRERK